MNHPDPKRRTEVSTKEVAQRGQAIQPAQSEATKIEQTRAVAEVEAAVLVAQRVPRDIREALIAMRESCGRLALARRAFYAVPNRGNGPTVHLARELARIWGNIQHGVHELRRDDHAGISEIQAFAWDVQANTRNSRTFIVPHAKMANKARQAITDLDDVYRNNQNVGAKAVRECIFAELPEWFKEEAMDLCRETLEKGEEGIPLSDRIEACIKGFQGLGITVEQLEAKTGRKRGTWTGQQVADLGIIYNSITRDGISQDELFPIKPVTAAEITGQPAKPAAAEDGPNIQKHAPQGEEPAGW